MIVRGYAAALYQLGRRYESACGAYHHPHEAARCIAKAAKLGDEAARIHLHARGPS